MKGIRNTGMQGAYPGMWKAYPNTQRGMQEAYSGTRGAMQEACPSPTKKLKKVLMILLAVLLVVSLTPITVFLFPKTAFADGEETPEEGVALAFPNINSTNPASHWTQAMWDEIALVCDFVGAEVIGSTYYSTNNQNSITFMVWNSYTNRLYVFVYCSHANHYVKSMTVAQADDPTPQAPRWQEKVNAPGHTVFEYTFSNGLPKNISITGGLNNGFDPGFAFVEFLTLDTSDLDIVYDGQAHQIPAATSDLSNAVITYKNPDTGVWGSSLPIATVTDVTNGWIDIEVMATAPNVSNYTHGVIHVRVTPRPITVKPVDASKVFDGAPLLTPHVVEVAAGSLYDLVAGQSFDVSKATFTGSQTVLGSSESTVSGVAINAGSKDITDNYSISYAPGTLKVTDGYEVTYAPGLFGDWAPVSIEGFTADSDDPAYPGATPVPPAGYELSLLPAYIEFAGWSDGINLYPTNADLPAYVTKSVTYVAQWEINNLSIVVNGNSTEAEYDGIEKDASGFAVIVTNNLDVVIELPEGFVVTADTSDPTAINVDETPIANVVTNVTIEFNGVDLTSQTCAGVHDGELKITPKTVSIVVENASKTYGEDDPVINGSVIGLIGSDDLDVAYGRMLGFDSEDAGFYPGVLTATYTPDSNYDVVVYDGNLTITAAPTPVTDDDDDDATDDDDDDVVVGDDDDDDVVVGDDDDDVVGDDDDDDVVVNDDDDDVVVNDDDDDVVVDDDNDDVVVNDDDDDVVVNDDDDDVVVTGTDNADDTPITPVIPVAPTVEPEVVDTPAPPSTPTIPIVDQDPPLAPVTPAPLTRLQDDFVPLANINASSWALINLLLAGAGVLLALTVLAAVLTRRSDSDKAAAKNQRGKSLIWGSASFAAGLVALIVFFMTQDISAAMALVDGWTILHVVILIAQVALTVLAVSKKAFENSTLRFEEIAA